MPKDRFASSRPGTSNGTHHINFLGSMGINKDDVGLIHTSLNSDKDLVLEIVAECKDENFSRFKTLQEGGGLEWVRTFTRLPDSVWDTWKKQAKKYQKAHQAPPQLATS